MDSELQRSYQLNMLKANGIVTILVAIVAICLKLQESGEVTVDARPRTTHGLVHVDESQHGRSGNRPTGTGFNGGFIKKLRIIPDGPVVADRSTIPVNYTFSADVEPNASDAASPASDAFDPVLELGNEDFGLPEVPPIDTKPVAAFAAFPTSVESIKPTRPDRNLTIFGWNDPRHPRKARGVTGKATVQIVVDKNGQVQAMTVVNEEPHDLGFAQALKNALYECRYEPPITGGQEVGMQVEITYEFDFRKAPTLQTSGNVSVISQK